MTTDIARGSVSVVEWLEHVLHPWTSYAIVPLFALANTGMALSVDIVQAALHSRITWAIIVARVIGKPLGILLATKTVIGARLADRPGDARGRQMVGVAMSAGMGFTVALFITELAFTDPVQRSNATLGSSSPRCSQRVVADRPRSAQLDRTRRPGRTACRGR